MKGLWTDVRFAARSLRRSPRFAAVAIAILALGIGANAAIFSLVDAVLLRPLPRVAEPAGLVDVVGETVSEPGYLAVAEAARADVRVAAWRDRSMSLAGAAVPRILRGAVVSGNYFDVLGVAPALGRFFRESENAPGEAVAVLSRGAWMRDFGSDPSVVGRAIRLNGVPVTVVGVAPAGFRGAAFGVFPEIWVPIGTWPSLATGPLRSLDLHSRNWGWLSLVGRRQSGVSFGRARTAVLSALERDAAAHGESFVASKWSVVPTVRTAAGQGSGMRPERVFAILAGAVAGGLLIACANLANLLLARAAARQRELAVKQALGAGRHRLVRQSLAESLLLSLGGGAAGLLLALWMLSALTRVSLPGDATLSFFEPQLGGRTAAFALMLSAAVGILFGILPALRAAAAVPATMLASTSRTVSPRSAGRGALVGIQVALCVALLATSGLLARSLTRALSIDLGLRTEGVTLAEVSLGLARYEPARAARFVEELPARLEARGPGTVAAWTTTLPLSGGQDEESVELEGYVPRPGERPAVDVAAVGAGYFRALRIPVREGREFTAEDRDGAPAVAVVNRALAARYFAGRGALGRRVKVGGGSWTIVGIVGDAKSASLTDSPVPQVWAPILQMPEAALSGLDLVVRSDSPAAARDAIVTEIRALDPSLPIEGMQSYSEIVGSRLLPQRLGAGLLALFGGLSLLLAAFGIYAVISWSAQRRARELGIRVALGARSSQIRRLVMRQTAGPVAVGAAAGLALAVVAGRLLADALYGVSAADPVALAASASALAAAAFAAAWLPARRASRVDPMTALRSE